MDFWRWTGSRSRFLWSSNAESPTNSCSLLTHPSSPGQTLVTSVSFLSRLGVMASCTTTMFLNSYVFFALFVSVAGLTVTPFSIWSPLAQISSSAPSYCAVFCKHRGLPKQRLPSSRCDRGSGRINKCAVKGLPPGCWFCRTGKIADVYVFFLSCTAWLDAGPFKVSLVSIRSLDLSFSPFVRQPFALSFHPPCWIVPFTCVPDTLPSSHSSWNDVLASNIQKHHFFFFLSVCTCHILWLASPWAFGMCEYYDLTCHERPTPQHLSFLQIPLPVPSHQHFWVFDAFTISRLQSVRKRSLDYKLSWLPRRHNQQTDWVQGKSRFLLQFQWPFCSIWLLSNQKAR